MKKLLLAVTLVVLLAAAVVGGQALASSKSSDVTVSEETSSILGSFYWGSPASIQTDEGMITVFDEITVTDIDYPQVRHVSLTLVTWGITAPDLVEIFILMPSGEFATVDAIQSEGFHTYEFDSDNIKIQAYEDGSFPSTISYYITTTYPRY